MGALSRIKMAEKIGGLLKERGLRLGLAESCTGGLLSNWITDIPGSSVYFRGGIVSYSEYAKMELLAVSPDTLRCHSAESGQTACEMADGVRRRLDADIGLSITGIAGPDGGSAGKPVGTVFIGWAFDGKVDSKEFRFHGTRIQVKEGAAIAALELLEGLLTHK